MYKSKPVLILKTFSKKDFRRFDEYINTPYFNRNKNIIALYKLLKKAHPNYDSKQIKREHIFTKLFPEMPFKEQSLRYVMTDLTKILEDFLAHQEYLNGGLRTQAPFLLQAYANRKLHKYFNQTYKNAEQNLEKNPIRDAQYYLTHYILEEMRFEFNTAQENHTREEFKKILSNLDNFFIAKKLKYCCEIRNNTAVMAINYVQPLLLNDILQHLDNQEEKPAVIINIYHQIYQSLTDKANEHYYDIILKQLLDYEHIFTKDEIHDLYVYLIILFNHFNR